MFTKSNCEIKSGFTLVELLVVISIIVLLSAFSLKSIGRSVANAKINKAKAEMTSLASTGATIFIDLKSRGYVPLCNYNIIKANISLSGVNFVNSSFPPLLLKILSGVAQPTGYATADFTTADFADALTFQDYWDGPYAVYQPKSTFNIPPGTGSYPKKSDGTDLPATDPSATVWAKDKFPDGTPLDAWGHPYGMGWNITEQVMIIYSAGPDGDFQTVPGDITVAASDDDLLYKFR